MVCIARRTPEILSHLLFHASLVERESAIEDMIRSQMSFYRAF